MNDIGINTQHPKLTIPRLFEDSSKNEKAIPKTAEDQNQLRFTTESSMEDNYTSAYQKLNPRKKGIQNTTPTTENWLG